MHECTQEGEGLSAFYLTLGHAGGSFGAHRRFVGAGTGWLQDWQRELLRHPWGTLQRGERCMERNGTAMGWRSPEKRG